MDNLIKLLSERFDNEISDDEDMSADGPSEDDIIVSSNGWKLSVSASGKHIGTFTEDDDAWNAVKTWMYKHKFYPNIWFEDDHGGLTLVDENGNHLSENTTSNLDGGEGQIRTPGAFHRPSSSKEDMKKQYQNSTTSTGYEIIESLYDLGKRRIKKVLSEATYDEWASDDKQTPRQKLNAVINEVHRKLYEIEQTVKRANKFKGEGGMGQDVYWKSTLPKLKKISERLLKISNIVREMSK